MRNFATGATRDDNTDKLDFKGFTSERADVRFAKYMHTHRRQADGTMRGSDNWKLGIPTTAYAESLYRHFKEWARLMEAAKEIGFEGLEPLAYPELMEIAQAIRFNLQGWVHEQDKKLDAAEAEALGRWPDHQAQAAVEGRSAPQMARTAPLQTKEEILPEVGSDALGGLAGGAGAYPQVADVADGGTVFQPLRFSRPPRTEDYGPEYETDGEAVSDAVGYQETEAVSDEAANPASPPRHESLPPNMARRISHFV